MGNYWGGRTALRMSRGGRQALRFYVHCSDGLRFFHRCEADKTTPVSTLREEILKRYQSERGNEVRCAQALVGDGYRLKEDDRVLEVLDDKDKITAIVALIKQQAVVGADQTVESVNKRAAEPLIESIQPPKRAKQTMKRTTVWMMTTWVMIVRIAIVTRKRWNTRLQRQLRPRPKQHQCPKQIERMRVALMMTLRTTSRR